MAYAPIAGIIPQYDQVSYYLKFYKPNTDTPISMSIDITGATLLAKAQLDVNGFPTTDGTTLFIPFLNQNYDAFLFPTAAEADANDTVNAFRVAENINPFVQGFQIKTFEDFGAIGDDSTLNDAAFASMVAQAGHVIATPGAIYRVSGSTDITVDNLTIDWSGATITIDETATTTQDPDQPLRNKGVFTVKGVNNSLIESSVAIIDVLSGGSSRFPITTPASFITDSWVIMTTGDYTDPVNTFSKTHNYLCKVLGTVNSGGNDFVQLDYINGYQIDIGTTVYYHSVTPIQNVHIIGGTIIDKSTTAVTTEWLCGVVMKYAANCTATSLTGIDMNLPLHRMLWSYNVESHSTRTEHPRKVGGGQGYAVQWQMALRCITTNPSGTKCRHVLDYTNAAFCSVENAFDTITQNGSYITHGQFEHNLDYKNMNGLLSFANSDVLFGESAKSIVVTGGKITQIIGANKVTDLTLNDLSVAQIGSIGNLGNCSFNNDGLVINNVVTTGDVIISNFSTLSTRKSIITNLTAPVVDARDATGANAVDITYIDCNIPDLKVHWAGFKAIRCNFSTGVNINNASSTARDVPAMLIGCETGIHPDGLHGNNMRTFETVGRDSHITGFIGDPVKSGYITWNGGSLRNEPTDLISQMGTDQRLKFSGTTLENIGFRMDTEDGATGCLTFTNKCEITGTNNNGQFIDLDSPLASTAVIDLDILDSTVAWTGSAIINSNSFSTINEKHRISISGNNLDGGDIDLFGNTTASGSLQFHNNTMNNLAIVVGGTGDTRSVSGNTLNDREYPLQNKAVSGTQNVGSDDIGLTFQFNSASDEVLNFIDGLPETFYCFAVNLGAGSVAVATLDTDTMRNNVLLADADGISAFAKISSTVWQRS